MTAFVRALGSLGAALAAGLVAGVVGCSGGSGEYVFRDIPFCVVDGPEGDAELQHRYVLLATGQPNGLDYTPVSSWELRADAPDLTQYGYQSPGGIRMVLVQCASSGPIRHPQRLDDEPKLK